MNNEKYKDCVLPVESFDNNTYGVYLSEIDITGEEHVNIYPNYYESFKGLIKDELYYSYSVLNKHEHSHSFDEVVKSAYYYPETFKIDESDYELYSNQELHILKSIQEYSTSCNLTDIKDNTEIEERAKSNRAVTINDCEHLRLDNKIANSIIIGETSSIVSKYFNETYPKIKKYILIDDDNNYLGLLSSITEKLSLDFLSEGDINYKIYGYNTLKEYKEHIVEAFNTNKYPMDDNQTILLEHLTVLEKFQ